jgi:hypothetical protein
MAEADAPMPTEAKAMAARIVKFGEKEDETGNNARVSYGTRRIDKRSSTAMALLRSGSVDCQLEWSEEKTEEDDGRRAFMGGYRQSGVAAGPLP